MGISTAGSQRRWRVIRSPTRGAAFGSQKAVIRATARYGPVRAWM
jgi:hypothetical protein